MFLVLGIRPGDLGLHSAQKGACSFAVVGSTVCPPLVSVCLWATWSMGSGKECCLQFEKAGDHYLGRVVSGLEVNDVSFAISPPYFECGDNEDDVKEKMLNLLKEFMVGGHGIQSEIFQLLFFASHHCVIISIFWLRFCPSEINCRHHPSLHTSLIMHERTVQFPWNKMDSISSFMGLPPHVSILAHESLKVALEEAKDSIIGRVKADLDGWRLGS